MERQNCKRYLHFSLVFLYFFTLFSFSGCTGGEPIKIGFVSDLSSRNSELGLQGRNGLIMAIEEINDNGGIRGRKFDYLIGNHKGDIELCDEVVKDLISQGANVIIGPMVSSMASTVIKAAEESGTLIISPTVSTDSLTGLDDNFLRVIGPASIQGKYLAQALLSSNIKNTVMILDRNNSSYTDDVSLEFHNELAGSPVLLFDNIYFENKENFPDIISALELIKPESIVFMATGIDTAGIVQLYGRENDLPQLYGSLWVKVTKIIEYGGKTVEGMILVDNFENLIPMQREIEFEKKYTDLYSTAPGIGAKASYESVQLFAEAFRESGSLEGSLIKETILKMDRIIGVADEFTLDRYGDGIRKLSFFIIEDSTYKLMSPDSFY